MIFGKDRTQYRFLENLYCWLSATLSIQESNLQRQGLPQKR